MSGSSNLNMLNQKIENKKTSSTYYFTNKEKDDLNKRYSKLFDDINKDDNVSDIEYDTIEDPREKELYLLTRFRNLKSKYKLKV